MRTHAEEDMDWEPLRAVLTDDAVGLLDVDGGGSRAGRQSRPLLQALGERLTISEGARREHTRIDDLPALLEIVALLVDDLEHCMELAAMQDPR